eukprot:SRR837773.7009.p1 GENE.SRR837773.7009~~SRR837773.7009.p1  ORF type:complete len:157 (-),score=9.59 SRR837773.7009:54-524(-)
MASYFSCCISRKTDEDVNSGDAAKPQVSVPSAPKSGPPAQTVQTSTQGIMAPKAAAPAKAAVPAATSSNAGAADASRVNTSAKDGIEGVEAEKQADTRGNRRNRGKKDAEKGGSNKGKGKGSGKSWKGKSNDGNSGGSRKSGRDHCASQHQVPAPR